MGCFSNYTEWRSLVKGRMPRCERSFCVQCCPVSARLQESWTWLLLSWAHSGWRYPHQTHTRRSEAKPPVWMDPQGATEVSAQAEELLTAADGRDRESHVPRRWTHTHVPMDSRNWIPWVFFFKKKKQNTWGWVKIWYNKGCSPRLLWFMPTVWSLASIWMYGIIFFSRRINYWWQLFK